jgi:dTDP-4-amino-4,6-dideoxygalactose transaminase
VKYCFFVSTGRAALTLLLSCFKELTGNNKNEVIMPSYTCFSVPASVAKAGLKINICDTDPFTLDYDYSKLSKIDFNNVLCIITSNLYGIPNDLKKLSDIAKEHNIFLIDDAAQCMGGKVDGQFSGTFGDAGIYSLDKGKNITSIEGGILVTNSDRLVSLLKSKINTLSSPSAAKNIAYLAKLFFYMVFLRPSLYWLPEKMPFLNLGKTVYSTEYPIESYSHLLGFIGYKLFKRIDEITKIRISNAKFLHENLYNVSYLSFPKYKDYIEPVFLRFPILVNDKDIRKKIVRELNEQGIGATKSYPTPISYIGEIRDIIKQNNIEGGKQIAEQIITLPTHPFVAEKDLKSIVTTIKQICKHI